MSRFKMTSESNVTNLFHFCPQPFLLEDNYPATGGFIAGRFCMPVAELDNVSCCLPCPLTDWTYRDGFNERSQVASWVNVAAFVITLYILLSFLILPVKWTHRHYLSVCLTIGIMFIELAFIVPLIAQPDQCYDSITPNDMHSQVICAISGSFLLFGGWCAVIWVFWRSLALHLQICWEVVPGKKFFYSALVFGWGIPALELGISLGLTGVSYRFGDTCHINHQDSLQDFWGPLLTFAALSVVLQFITLGYCIQVFIKSIFGGESSTASSSRPPTYQNSVSTASAKHTMRRVKRIIQMQWRGALVVLLIIAECIFFAIVFVSMDNTFQIDQDLLAKAKPWLLCLASTEGEKNECLYHVRHLIKPEGVVIAVLVCLGCSGFWVGIFFGRWSMILGWRDLVRRKLTRRHEFVSIDARKIPGDAGKYEMLSGKQPQLTIQTPDKVLMSPSLTKSPLSAVTSTSSPDDYKSHPYISPVSSYSSPRPPSTGHNREWDPFLTYARGNNNIARVLTRNEYDV